MVNGFIVVLVGREAIPSDTEDQLTVMGVFVIRKVVDYELLWERWHRWGE